MNKFLTQSQTVNLIVLCLMSAFVAFVQWATYRHIYIPPVLVAEAGLAGTVVAGVCRSYFSKFSGASPALDQAAMNFLKNLASSMGNAPAMLPTAAAPLPAGLVFVPGPSPEPVAEQEAAPAPAPVPAMPRKIEVTITPGDGLTADELAATHAKLDELAAGKDASNDAS